MSDYCEIIEDLATATSSIPVADTISVLVSNGAATSSLVLGLSLPVFVSTADASSVMNGEAYTLVTEQADATSSITSVVDNYALLISKAKATSSTISAFTELLVSTADATGTTIALDTPHLFVSLANASSTISGSTTSVQTLVSQAEATSMMWGGYDNLIVDTADAVSSVVLLRTVSVMLTDTGNATSTAFPSNMPEVLVLTSEAQAVSLVITRTDYNAGFVSTASATSSVSFKNPGLIAWVLNTETTAGSWYDNFDFESIAQASGKVLAVGPDGLYELKGATDSGDTIDAEVITGFMDFGSDKVKRVDEIYFGYTSEGQISVTTETYDSGHSPTNYVLEQRDANAPRNSRVTPGKGMWGRYWRMKIRNVAGADFVVYDTTVDIAVSPRRV